MVDRKDIGFWLEGPNARTDGGGDYPGQRLGMPRGLRRDRTGRRVLGVLIDWTLCTIAYGVFGVPLPFTELAGARGWVVLVVFAVENLLLVGTLGFTIGHRIAGLRVRSISGAGQAAAGDRADRALQLFLPAILGSRWSGGCTTRRQGPSSSGSDLSAVLHDLLDAPCGVGKDVGHLPALLCRRPCWRQARRASSRSWAIADSTSCRTPGGEFFHVSSAPPTGWRCCGPGGRPRAARCAGLALAADPGAHLFGELAHRVVEVALERGDVVGAAWTSARPASVIR